MPKQNLFITWLDVITYGFRGGAYGEKVAIESYTDWRWVCVYLIVRVSDRVYSA